MQSIHPADIIKDIKPSDLTGAKVVFINMPLRESAQPTTTPEGPLLMATNLIQNYSVDAGIIDLNAYRPDGKYISHQETFQLIKDHVKFHGEPHVIAFSGMITTLRWQEIIAKMVRKIAPDVFLVSGSGLATELKLGLFNYIPELDAIAHSEGDEVIIKIIYDAKLIKERGIESAITSGKLNPYYLGEINGRHRFMYAGDRPKDLDRLPFSNLEIIKTDVYGNQILQRYLDTPVWGAAANNSSATSFTMKQSTTFVSSRGCPYACAFCYRGAQGERNYGVRSAKNLAEQFKLHIEKYNVDFIGMPDDNFGVDYNRIVELVPLLKPLNIRWGTHTRLDEAAGLRPKSGNPCEYIFENPKRVDLMAEAGCIYIGFGAESASPSVLKAMNKGGFILKNGLTDMQVDGKVYQFPRTMIEGIRNCEYAGIHANCTWIMAYPTETLEDLKMSVAFIKWQEDFYSSCDKSADSVNKRMFTATWYPGTEMLQHPKVKRTLNEVFGINFNPVTGEPICDENFHQYVLELDDATKLLYNPKTGEPLNFSDMPMNTFLKAREYIDRGQTFKILEM